MNIINLKNITKPIKIEQNIYWDNRGYFQEIFLKKNFGLNIKFTAIAKSKKNVIRGMHFQLKNKQTKFLYVVHGRILDVVVDLNKKSKNFGKVYKFTLNAGEIIFVPNNYAHGYECLSSKCTVLYHLERYRDAKNESGIIYNDKNLKIKWKTKKPILSLRDQSHMSFLDFKKNHKSL
jgi:dTDP-4-dehydrorhamnose 3,5-epimerase